MAELPEREYEEAEARMGLLTLNEENATSSSSAAPQTQIGRNRRRRFLILSHLEGRQTEKIEGRVTLSAYAVLVPVTFNDDCTDDSDLWMDGIPTSGSDIWRI